MGKRFLHQLVLAVAVALFVSPVRSGDWLPATATFYGGADGSDTMGNNLAILYLCLCVVQGTHACIATHTDLIDEHASWF